MSRTLRSERKTEESRKSTRERELRFDHWMRTSEACLFSKHDNHFDRLFDEAMRDADEMFLTANPEFKCSLRCRCWDCLTPQSDVDELLMITD
jgi:hypothetical protein